MRGGKSPERRTLGERTGERCIEKFGEIVLVVIERSGISVKPGCGGAAGELAIAGSAGDHAPGEIIGHIGSFAFDEAPHTRDRLHRDSAEEWKLLIE